ncbi:MAG: outer membrane protein assembly factor, partial [Flavobacteriia bacterium]|nr:outer membrane protein assembly factor [Flavobacteriia bacterium]
MYSSQAKLLILFLTTLVLSGCYSTKALQNQPVEIEKNEVYLDAKLVKNTPVNFIITTPVNKKFAGIPVKKILYQSAHPEPKEYFEKWLTKTEKRKQRIEKWLSEKQLKALENYTVKFNQWLKKNGEPPALLDTVEIDKSKKRKERERLFNLFRNNGIYNFQQNSIQFIAAIDSTGTDLTIPVTLVIENPQQQLVAASDSIYKAYQIKDIAVFIDDFNTEINTLQFTDSITYQGVGLYSKGKLKYKPQALVAGIAIQKNKPYSDLERNLTYRYFTNLKNFKYPSIVYSLLPQEEALKASIYLTPRERFSLGFDLDFSHSNIQDFGIGLGGGLGIRNVFRGAETLELNIKNTLGASRDIAQVGDQFFNLFELGADLKLSFPRLVFPFFGSEWTSLEMNPLTQMIIGTSLQKNIGLDKQFFKSTYQFDWQPKKNKKIQIKWIDFEFVNNRNSANYFNVYRNSYDRLNSVATTYNTITDFEDEQGNLSIPEGAENFINAVLNGATSLNLENPDYKVVNTVKERLDRLTANNLILGSSFSLNFNNQQSIFDENFYQLRWKIDWVGNLLNSALSTFNAQENSQGQKLLGGVIPSQYIKSEIDYIKHWPVAREQLLAFHAFGGLAIPYGNANNMPFSRSYFSGGSNDNRAWKAYKLGPGSSNNINEFNEANFKLAFNLEYRFPLTGPLKGGLFIDAGNVWNIFDEVEDPAFRFEGFRDLSEIAIGSGFGLRYDFDFFVFRFDTGFKTYNPALPEGSRWWSEYN